MTLEKGTNTLKTTEDGYRFNGKLWTKSSGKLVWLSAVRYGQDRNARLQTLDEAVEFRHGMKGEDSSNNYQHTSTLIATGMVFGKLRGFVYEPAFDELVEFAGQDGLAQLLYLEVSKDSKWGKRFLASERTFPVTENLELNVQPDNQGDSAYSKNEVVEALMPNSAKKNAEILHLRGYLNGRVWFDRTKLSNEVLRILPVGLGGVGYVRYVFADNLFDHAGCARAVAQDAVAR